MSSSTSFADQPSHSRASVDMVIHKIFREIARSSPESVAVESLGITLIYRELNDRSGRVASYLRRQGVSDGTRVGLCMDRSVEMIIGMLGILKAGGVYVPMDPEYPRERLAFMLREVGAPVILTLQGSEAVLPQSVASVISLDRDWPLIEACEEGEHEVASAVGSEDTAYVIFTSGSTGQPKGVMVPHCAVGHLVLDTNYIDLGPQDNVAHLSNVCFDAATFEIWGALLNGARLVIIPKRVALEPRQLAAELRQRQVSTLFATTALFNLLAAWNARFFEGIKRVLFGGEAVNAQRVRQVLQSGGAPERLLHVYGPTECTTFATFYPVTEVAEGASNVPIGRPISNTTAYVFDPQCNPVPAGVPGELYLGGPRLAHGYLNHPELTREKFVTVALTAGERERLYRTGDLVRSLPDGSIEFLGRLDRQMKIRGFRIEPGEIENRLDAHPALESSVVIAKTDPAGHASLVAFFIVADGQPAPSCAELSAHLAQTLPDYMVPSLFVQRSEWPLSAIGKLDRDALLRSLSLSSVEPQARESSSPEGLLRELCRKVLGTSPVGLDDSLLALGLHSLSAANLAWLIEEQFQVRIRLSEILDCPTLGRLLTRIESGRNSEVATLPGGIVSGLRPEVLPLSFAQEQIWFLERLYPELNCYRFQALLHCRGTLDVGALEGALNRLVGRHEILRTVFLAGEDQVPRQEIRPHIPFRLVPEDLRGLPEEVRQAKLDSLIYDELRKPFDFAHGPLIRWRLFQLGDHEYELLHTEHHFLHDGWGYGSLLAELFATYKALNEKAGLSPEAPPPQFADFAVCQREMMACGAWDDQLDYWKKELAGCPPPPSLPSDRRLGGPRTFEGAQIRSPFPQALWEELGRVCSREGVTRFEWIQAAFQLFIHRYTGAQDFCVGSGFANRRDERLRGMLGMVINTLPVRARFDEVTTFRDLVRRASCTLRGASDNQELPFERLVQEMNPQRDANSNPFFNTCIGSYEEVFPHFRSDQLEITSDDGLPCGHVKFDLMALFVPSKRPRGAADPFVKSAAPIILWEFSTELFDASTGERMLKHFLCLLESTIRDPDMAIERLLMMSDEERQQILRFGQSPSPEVGDMPIHRVFEQVAESSPDCIAVASERGTFSYRELSDRSSTLARYLRAQGVGDGVRVGLCMDRSAEMIVGMLGTLKAGGVYVPLDPSYPTERLVFMIRDTEAALVLSTEVNSERVKNCGARVTLLDRDWALIEAGGVEQIVNSVGVSDLAYVIFTSGSTGVPKGVAVPHRGVLRLVLNTNYIDLGSRERVAHLSNVCFDAATFEIWGALLNGARVVVIPKEITLDPRQFAAELSRQKVTTLFLTTALFNEMASEDRTIFKGIKQVLFGGEAVNPHWVTHVLRSGGAPERLLHVYGPTECTTFATFYPVEHLPEEAGTVPIGRPISNTTAYVLDRAGNPVPVGVPGELYLGGCGLAKGYLNRPELTREKFVADPFGGADALVYRTGDIVKYLPDGNIEFIGRADGQTKIRGFRIEPGEVEAVLKHHPGIEDAAVIAREDTAEERKLVGYVVPRSGNSFKDWRVFLQDKLPFYMIPSAIVELPKLPMTASGKVDRMALPKPERQAAEARCQAPLTATEEAVSAVWAKVLRVEDFDPHENFFDLGGHSLLATQVISQLRTRLGVEVPLRAVFDNPTVTALAEFIESTHWAGQNMPGQPKSGSRREEALF